MKPTLLILAAGMGSRYGGIKQLDTVGPQGETIMDYSVADAVEAGFDHIVFVIREALEEDFKSLILSKYERKIKVSYVFQELDYLPQGFVPNPERSKPYGTAHAILSAKDAIKAPFAAINADDFYGRDAFMTMSKFLQEEHCEQPPHFAMIGYQLGKTLSENGTVSRGVCTTDADGFLIDIKEMTKIKRYPEGIKNVDEKGEEIFLNEDVPVSMNFWGFQPLVFSYLETLFVRFLKENKQDVKAEFQIPTVINEMLHRGDIRLKVLKSTADWFGITYQEDRAYVRERLRNFSL